MKHIHHIIPKHMGGTDDPSNLIELTIEEHALAHKALFEKYGKQQDYIAWKGLEGCISIEEILHARCSMGGKKGVETLRKLKKCSYFNDELRKKSAKKGQMICKEKQTGFYDSKLQSKLGKRGGPKNKGFCWINDGTINIKYSNEMQKSKSVEDFLKENPSFNLGRIQPSKIVMCPHCNKSGYKSAMVLHHFDNCMKVTGQKRTFTMKKKECPHCGQTGAGGSMTRWHFNNCKHKKE